ncbi:unnamed protein product [Orchesella dallaii]|uniref:Protein kinase domain-containing protein n=1 Tax=Orchesella dallaii TaxID=48710 RepID=A0ABP1Q630_9HEXA
MSDGIFGLNDIEDLNTLACAPFEQARKFYNTIIKREHGFLKLVEALKETKQSGALKLLTDTRVPRKLSDPHLNDAFSYDEKSVIGRGSNGTVVFRGKLGERKVAVKRIHSNIVNEKIIIEEIKVLKSCDAHENVVRYFNIKEYQQHVLIILELCDMTLKEWVTNKSNFTS